MAVAVGWYYNKALTFTLISLHTQGGFSPELEAVVFTQGQRTKRNLSLIASPSPPGTLKLKRDSYHHPREQTAPLIPFLLTTQLTDQHNPAHSNPRFVYCDICLHLCAFECLCEQRWRTTNPIWVSNTVTFHLINRFIFISLKSACVFSCSPTKSLTLRFSRGCISRCSSVHHLSVSLMGEQGAAILSLHLRLTTPPLSHTLASSPDRTLQSQLLCSTATATMGRYKSVIFVCILVKRNSNPKSHHSCRTETLHNSC